MKKFRSLLMILIAVLVLVLLLIVLLYGCFHKYQTWPEEKFIGTSILEFRRYLNNRGITLCELNGPFSRNDRNYYEKLSGKKIPKDYRLFFFWGGDNHRFINFPIGTVSYGAYVLVVDGVIVYFEKVKCIDSL